MASTAVTLALAVAAAANGTPRRRIFSRPPGPGAVARREVLLSPEGGLGRPGGSVGAETAVAAARPDADQNGAGRGTALMERVASDPGDARNLVLFFDGAGQGRNKTCRFPPGSSCRSNIADLYSLVPSGEKLGQLTWYANGEGTGGIGTGHAVSGYRWLSDTYLDGDAIFIFGFGRGALCARSVQGMIHKVGLAKKGRTGEALDVLANKDTTLHASFKNDLERAWGSAHVHFLGLFEGGPNTKNRHPKLQDPRDALHTELTSSVKNFYHALSLDEYRAGVDSAELLPGRGTNEEQVWFFGLHNDVGGGYPEIGPRMISLGWMADRAVDHGIIISTGWSALPQFRPNFMIDIHIEYGLSDISGLHSMVGGALKIRDPTRCRAKLFGPAPLRFHKSVQDRMKLVRGWVPLPFCCKGTREQLQELGVQWISSPHYDRSMLARPPVVGPQWIRLHIGNLRGVVVPYVEFLPLYYVKIQSWHSSVDLPEGRSAASLVSDSPTNSSGTVFSGVGCCTPHRGDAPSGRNAKVEKRPDGLQVASVDFTGLSVLLPAETAVADMLIVEVFEDNVPNDSFVGRAALKLGDDKVVEMRPFHIDGEKGSATLEIGADYIKDDHSIQGLLGRSNPAQCQWLADHSGRDGDELCGPGSEAKGWMYRQHNVEGSGDCDGFIQDVRSGA